MNNFTRLMLVVVVPMIYLFLGTIIGLAFLADYLEESIGGEAALVMLLIPLMFVAGAFYIYWAVPWCERRER